MEAKINDRLKSQGKLHSLNDIKTLYDKLLASRSQTIFN